MPACCATLRCRRPAPAPVAAGAALCHEAQIIEREELDTVHPDHILALSGAGKRRPPARLSEGGGPAWQ